MKASWRSSLEVHQLAAVAMAEWERKPPENNKELFAEIDQSPACLMSERMASVLCSMPVFFR